MKGFKGQGKGVKGRGKMFGKKYGKKGSRDSPVVRKWAFKGKQLPQHVRRALMDPQSIYDELQGYDVKPSSPLSELEKMVIEIDATHLRISTMNRDESNEPVLEPRRVLPLGVLVTARTASLLETDQDVRKCCILPPELVLLSKKFRYTVAELCKTLMFEDPLLVVNKPYLAGLDVVSFMRKGKSDEVAIPEEAPYKWLRPRLQNDFPVAYGLKSMAYAVPFLGAKVEGTEAVSSFMLLACALEKAIGAEYRTLETKPPKIVVGVSSSVKATNFALVHDLVKCLLAEPDGDENIPQIEVVHTIKGLARVMPCKGRLAVTAHVTARGVDLLVHQGSKQVVAHEYGRELGFMQWLRSSGGHTIDRFISEYANIIGEADVGELVDFLLSGEGESLESVTEKLGEGNRDMSEVLTFQVVTAITALHRAKAIIETSFDGQSPQTIEFFGVGNVCGDAWRQIIERCVSRVWDNTPIYVLVDNGNVWVPHIGMVNEESVVVPTAGGVTTVQRYRTVESFESVEIVTGDGGRDVVSVEYEHATLVPFIVTMKSKRRFFYECIVARRATKGSSYPRRIPVKLNVHQEGVSLRITVIGEDWRMEKTISIYEMTDITENGVIMRSIGAVSDMTSDGAFEFAGIIADMWSGKLNGGKCNRMLLSRYVTACVNGAFDPELFVNPVRDDMANPPKILSSDHPWFEYRKMYSSVSRYKKWVSMLDSVLPARPILKTEEVLQTAVGGDILTRGVSAFCKVYAIPEMEQLEDGGDTGFTFAEKGGSARRLHIERETDAQGSEMELDWDDETTTGTSVDGDDIPMYLDVPMLDNGIPMVLDGVVPLTDGDGDMSWWLSGDISAVDISAEGEFLGTVA